MSMLDNEILTQVVSEMVTPVVVTDMSMNILYVNDNTLKVFGYKHKELIGQKVNILMNNHDSRHHDVYVESYKRTPQNSKIIGKKPRLVQGKHKDGSELHLYITITESDNKFTAVFTDVTQQIQEKIDKEYIKKVFNFVSHEYRNMYFGAHTLCLDIKEEIQSRQNISKDIDQIIHIHEKMSKLFDDVLLMQKLESKQLKYEKLVFPIINVIEDAIKYAHVQERKFKMNFEYNIENQVNNCNIFGNEDRLYQGIINIISNAFKYNITNGKVTLCNYIQDTSLIIEIQDTGVGIPDDKKTIIFNPYNRLSTGSSRNGTGLGLTFTKEFIETGNGGKLEVINNKPIGSIFKITIPIYNIKINEKQETELIEEEILPYYDILLIDDDDVICMTFSKYLKRLSPTLSILTAHSGEEAIDIIQNNHNFKLIIIDHSMGVNRYTGSETIQKIREMGVNTNIIGLTGLESNDIINEMKNAGAEDIIIKGPNAFKKINNYVKKLIGIP